MTTKRESTPLSPLERYRKAQRTDRRVAATMAIIRRVTHPFGRKPSRDADCRSDVGTSTVCSTVVSLAKYRMDREMIFCNPTANGPALTIVDFDRVLKSVPPAKGSPLRYPLTEERIYIGSVEPGSSTFPPASFSARLRYLYTGKRS